MVQLVKELFDSEHGARLVKRMKELYEQGGELQVFL